MGKKESEHATSRSSRRNKILICGYRVSVVKLVLLQGGRKIGGMEIESEM